MPTIKDRSRLCVFTFADGRQCRTPRRSGHQHLCYYHAKKEAKALIAKQAGEDLASLFCGKVLCASELAVVLGRVLSVVARGYIKPKTAVSLALLGHTLNQSLKIAQDANAPGGNAHPKRVVSCLKLLSRRNLSTPPNLLPALNHHRNQFRPKFRTIEYQHLYRASDNNTRNHL